MSAFQYADYFKTESRYTDCLKIGALPGPVTVFKVVKVWDFDTGRQVFEFGGTRDLISITCMTFDFKGRR